MDRIKVLFQVGSNPMACPRKIHPPPPHPHAHAHKRLSLSLSPRVRKSLFHLRFPDRMHTHFFCFWLCWHRIRHPIQPLALALFLCARRNIANLQALRLIPNNNNVKISAVNMQIPQICSDYFVRDRFVVLSVWFPNWMCVWHRNRDREPFPFQFVCMYVVCSIDFILLCQIHIVLSAIHIVVAKKAGNTTKTIGFALAIGFGFRSELGFVPATRDIRHAQHARECA